MSNLRLNIRQTYNGVATQAYEVTLLEGEWPKEHDLVTMCDNRSTTDLTVRHFGGSAVIYGKHADVKVFVD